MSLNPAQAILHIHVTDGVASLPNAGVEVHTDRGALDLEVTDEHGKAAVPIPAGHVARFVHIMPTTGHWQRGVLVSAPLTRGLQVSCVPIAPMETPPWFHTVLGKRTHIATAGAGIRIGVVDYDFEPQGRLSRIRRVLGDGLSPASHGARVCRLIGEQGTQSVWGGMAPGATMYFAAIDDPGEGTTLDVADAIEALIEMEEPPDLINMSLGFWRAALPAGVFANHPDLERVLDSCWDAGCLPIAAVGNDASRPVALPAAYDNVVGVAAVGPCNLAPRETWAATLEGEARAAGRFATEPGGLMLFHSNQSAFGQGVDVCAPGVAVLLEQEDGILYDCVGTSYSAPLVTGVLALKLSTDAVYRTKTGRARAQHALDALRAMARPLPGLRSECGEGIPQL